MAIGGKTVRGKRPRRTTPRRNRKKPSRYSFSADRKRRAAVAKAKMRAKTQRKRHRRDVRDAMDQSNEEEVGDGPETPSVARRLGDVLISSLIKAKLENKGNNSDWSPSVKIAFLLRLSDCPS